MIYYLNPINLTFSNNLFLNLYFSTNYGFAIYHNEFINCPTFYNDYIITNNTVINTDKIRLSYFYCFFDFKQSGIQRLVYSNNSYINTYYGGYGLIYIAKSITINFVVEFENNYFERVYN